MMLIKNFFNFSTLLGFDQIIHNIPFCCLQIGDNVGERPYKLGQKQKNEKDNFEKVHLKNVSSGD